MLLPTGLRSLEDFRYGRIAGRYERDFQKKNKKGESLNYWKGVEDFYIDANGAKVKTESMWNYVDYIQRDFAARARWCVETNYCEENHAPEFAVENEKDLFVKAGEEMVVHTQIKGEFSGDINCEAFIYPEVSSCHNLKEVKITQEISEEDRKERDFYIKLPENAQKEDKIHVIFTAQKEYGYKLKSFSRVIIHIV